MQVSLTQIFLTVFLLFAFSRVIVRFGGGVLSTVSFLFWSGLFGLATLIVLFPGVTSRIAQFIGIGRGADVVIYVSITLLFYLVFRIYIYLEDIRRDITDIVSKIALEKSKKKNAKNPS